MKQTNEERKAEAENLTNSKNSKEKSPNFNLSFFDLIFIVLRRLLNPFS